MQEDVPDSWGVQNQGSQSQDMRRGTPSSRVIVIGGGGAGDRPSAAHRCRQLLGYKRGRMGHLSFLAYLVVFSYLSVTASVSLDLTELRNKVSKIKVNPRGNLWATGHFMGKKSLFDYPGGYDTTSSRLPMNSPEGPKDLKSLLTRKMLDVALAQEAEGRRVRYDSGTEGTELIMKMIERYVKNTKSDEHP
ncbi:neuromedin Ba [Heterodontus francisci]|uniref:neuromedin Ba n=1 Tax=Heterodontus francisci TaxID=7792 RepID=UPI00355B9DC8